MDNPRFIFAQPLGQLDPIPRRFLVRVRVVRAVAEAAQGRPLGSEVTLRPAGKENAMRRAGTELIGEKRFGAIVSLTGSQIAGMPLSEQRRTAPCPLCDWQNGQAAGETSDSRQADHRPM